MLFRSVTGTGHNITTSIFTKPTTTDECLNYDSLCPDRYKITAVKNFLHRAYSICSSWELFHDELRRIKHVVINNNFPNYIIDKQIIKFINEKIKSNNLTDYVRRVVDKIFVFLCNCRLLFPVLRLFVDGYLNAVKLRIYGSSVIKAILREPRFPDRCPHLILMA